jgi:hypothetical protein
VSSCGGDFFPSNESREVIKDARRIVSMLDKCVRILTCCLLVSAGVVTHRD